jgi:hypothetical protein
VDEPLVDDPLLDEPDPPEVPVTAQPANTTAEQASAATVANSFMESSGVVKVFRKSRANRWGNL